MSLVNVNDVLILNIRHKKLKIMIFSLQFFKPSQVFLYFQRPLCSISYYTLGNLQSLLPVFGPCVKASLMGKLRSWGRVYSDGASWLACMPLWACPQLSGWDDSWETEKGTCSRQIQRTTECNLFLLKEQIDCCLVKSYLGLNVVVN